ncbi:MAG: hypothetical protein ACE5LV_08420, partial [Candidatus Aminicenantales bacterium]
LMSLLLGAILLFPHELSAYEIFIYRPARQKDPVFRLKKLVVHGEFFGYLLMPSRYPSYNDLTGPDDRWNYGFQNRIDITENISFLAQLLTHDDGGRRTKFDWHFSLRISPLEHLQLILGHDSNHDSDYESVLDGKAHYLNRNYIGFGIPFEVGMFYFEPFTWFLHHTNHRGHLDLSGEELIQEYGIRVGVWPADQLGVSLQVFNQSEALFSLGQALRCDLIIRAKLAEHVELSTGLSLWQDIQASRLGNQQTFYHIHWGLAIPF